MTTLHTTHLHNDYLDGDLSEQQRAEVKRHLDECSQCRLDMDRLERLTSIIGGVETPDPGEEYFGNLSDKIASRTTAANRIGADGRYLTDRSTASQILLKTLIRLAAVVTLLFASFYISNIKEEKDSRRWADKISEGDYVVTDSTVSGLPIEPQTGINRVGSPTPVNQTETSDPETRR